MHQLVVDCPIPNVIVIFMEIAKCHLIDWPFNQFEQYP
jgi:hypothetical protein